MRTDQQIVDETNALALWFLNEVYGYEVPDGHKFYEADDPRSKKGLAKGMQNSEIMTKTDPNDALSALDADDEVEEPVIREYGVRLWGTFRACTEDTIEATSFEEAIQKAAALSLGNYSHSSFTIESLDGDESASVFGPDDDNPDDENAWGGDGHSVELHDDGEPMSWEAVQLTKDLAVLFDKGWESRDVEKLIVRAHRACIKITGGMEG